MTPITGRCHRLKPDIIVDKYSTKHSVRWHLIVIALAIMATIAVVALGQLK